jgi:hypothetical protein
MVFCCLAGRPIRPPGMSVMEAVMHAHTFVVLLIGALLSVGSAAAAEKPAEGFTLHIDAKLHFPGAPDMVAHHYCKEVAGGMTECLLFESDEPNARLVGVEVIVGADAHAALPDDEKAMWHYHKEEIAKVSATLPDVSAEEGAKVLKDVEETYGKVYLLWDPGNSDKPIGNPSVAIVH